MMYATAPQGNRITATPGAEGNCPLCGADLVPKCGQINVWHWAHKITADCDPWYESETAWHFGWKQLVQPAFCEFRMPPHRADILGNAATVIELQHSSISPEEIEKRERFYDNMIWLFDGTNLNGRFQYRREAGYPGCTWWTVSFEWKHCRRSIRHCTKPVHLDIGHGWLVRFVKLDIEYGAWYGEGVGILASHSAFIEHYLSQVKRPS